MEFALRLDPSLPKRRAVEHAIRDAIATRSLGAGTRLPSTRELSGELQVARNTIVAVFEDLTAEGVLEVRGRAGTFVARDTARARPLEATPRRRPIEFDLRPGQPDQGSFPMTRWLAALRRATSTTPPDAVEAIGAWELRTQLAAYLGRARGVEARAENIVVCAGYRGACTVLACALAEQRRMTIAIEDPSLPGIERPWRAAGMRVIDLPVDEDGADVGRITSAVDVVMLTPSHQFPMGGALSSTRRRLVSDWAVNRGGFIIEDDYDGEFRFDRRPIAALQRTDPDHVIYAGSTSKTLSPGLRLGWLVLPSDLVQPVVEAAEALTGGVPVLNQLTLAELIRTGDYERHIRRQRREYARRRAHLQDALWRAGIEVPGIPAGLHALIRLDPRRAANFDRVAMHALAHYERTHHHDPALVVGFAAPQRKQFEPAVSALEDALRSAGVIPVDGGRLG